MHAFQKYVDMKWPLRVYAIEPVIAQQNVADAFGRRKFLALDLLGANSTGPLKALTGIEAQRQATEDETAIRLNPTMVGFGAGQSTFGWIFYPRLQTSGGKRGRLITDIALLVSGRVPDPTGSDQSIEPGQRECTALVEMPNFVPKIEFVTVANWFRTSEVGDGQKSDLEKAAVLGRKLVLAEEALNRARIEGHYRPEEYQIASERLSPAQEPDAHPAHGRARTLRGQPERRADLLLTRLTASTGLDRLARQAARRRRRNDAVSRRHELQHPRHPRDRRRKTRHRRTGQPAIASGHDSQRCLSHAECAGHLASRHQRRDAQRRVESPPHQDATGRSASRTTS